MLLKYPIVIYLTNYLSMKTRVYQKGALQTLQFWLSNQSASFWMSLAPIQININNPLLLSDSVRRLLAVRIHFQRQSHNGSHVLSRRYCGVGERFCDVCCSFVGAHIGIQPVHGHGSWQWSHTPERRSSRTEIFVRRFGWDKLTLRNGDRTISQRLNRKVSLHNGRGCVRAPSETNIKEHRCRLGCKNLQRYGLFTVKSQSHNYNPMQTGLPLIFWASDQNQNKSMNDTEWQNSQVSKEE